MARMWLVVLPMVAAAALEQHLVNSSYATANNRRMLLGLKHMAAHGHDPGKDKSKKRAAHPKEDYVGDDGDVRNTVEENEASILAGNSLRGSEPGAKALSVVGAETSDADLRHAGMNSWKKKKTELCLALKKASGEIGKRGKPICQAGLTAKEKAVVTEHELSALVDEVARGGRMAKVPCSPPHCSFRCATDRPCKTHPLMKKWREPQPRVCMGGRHEVWPISFGIPASEVVECVPLKAEDFATVVPFRERSYVFGPADEAEYKRDYRKARFGFTRMKAGWDCVRHYEILASGTVPMFFDIDKAPLGVLPHLPKDLLSFVRHKPYFQVKGCEMKHVLGACSFSLNHDLFDQDEYESVSCSLLEHTKKHLTTRALAAYALRSAGWGNQSSAPDLSPAFSQDQYFKDPADAVRAALPKDFRALYLGGAASSSDYLRDTMLHGFRDLLGDKLFEYNSPPYMYDWPSDTRSNSAAFNPNDHWGMGFSISRRLHYMPHNHLRNATGAADLLSARYFDVVIYGNAHRGLPLWHTVIKAKYTKQQVIVFNGEDMRGWKLVEGQQETHKILDRSTYFLREMPDGCPGSTGTAAPKKKNT